jgi:hypothetical protein
MSTVSAVPTETWIAQRTYLRSLAGYPLAAIELAQRGHTEARWLTAHPSHGPITPN